ncbi:MAG TPA: hypothetical protein VG842_10440 [Sediminibacterium sp.]|nr:hypothetical protein [Sediminibacterium sp.]
MLQLYPHSICLLLALLLSAIYYRQLSSSAFRVFLPFLFILYFAETAWGSHHGGARTRENVTYYYFVSLVEASFYGYLFLQNSRARVTRFFILALSGINICMHLTGLIFFTHDHLFYLWVLLVSAFLIVLTALCYVYHIYVFCEEIFILRDPAIWVGLGIALFFPGNSLVICLHELIYEQQVYLLGEPLYDIFPRFLAIFLYLFISIAILQCIRQKTLR